MGFLQSILDWLRSLFFLTKELEITLVGLQNSGALAGLAAGLQRLT